MPPASFPHRARRPRPPPLPLLLLLPPPPQKAKAGCCCCCAARLPKEKPPADAFIGFGGVVARDAVVAKADWFVKDFHDVVAALAED